MILFASESMLAESGAVEGGANPLLTCTSHSSAPTLTLLAVAEPFARASICQNQVSFFKSQTIISNFC